MVTSKLFFVEEFPVITGEECLGIRNLKLDFASKEEK